jgi:hypothetical protein
MIHADGHIRLIFGKRKFPIEFCQDLLMEFIIKEL